MTEHAQDQQPQSPTFTVTRGSLTPEEIAAVTVVLSAASQAGAASSTPAGGQASGWRNRHRMMPSWATRSGWGAR